MTGKLIFAPVPKLPANWWTTAPADDPAIVWTVWDKQTYYLWGANEGNYQHTTIGQVIGGGGMAGSTGPTEGMGHPHYIGINTMEYQYMAHNDAVFDALNTHIQNGQNVVVPVHTDDKTTPCMAQYSLGTGIGAGVPHWADIQKYILQKLVGLAATAGPGNLVIPHGTFWPDCRVTTMGRTAIRQEPNYPRYVIKTVDDINTIISLL